jgi:tetratricopeptide (TPR) repeat protein
MVALVTESASQAMEQPIADIEYGPIALSLILLLPFLVWGFYTLRVRFVMHHELHPAIEAATLFAVAVFFWLEFQSVERMFRHDTGLYVMSLIGLYVSGIALYGHMVISLMSHALVNSLLPARYEGTHNPAYGAAEAREQSGDLEGAIKEYLVIARTFPRDHKAQIRLGDNLMKLERIDEAAPWFERGMGSAANDEDCLLVVNRLFDIYFRRMDRIDDAERVLASFLERFPDSHYVATVSRRLAKVQAGGMPSSFDFRNNGSANQSADVKTDNLDENEIKTTTSERSN